MSLPQDNIVGTRQCRVLTSGNINSDANGCDMTNSAIIISIKRV